MVSLHRPSSPGPSTTWQSSSSAASSSYAPPPPLPDASSSARRNAPALDLFTDDDSDVMVRTAQASRLRRRGAIRIEAARRSSPPEEDLNTPFNTVTSFTTRHALSANDFENGRALYCGGVVSKRYVGQPVEPIPFASSSTHRREEPLSTGCGALVHYEVAPSQRLGVWLANSEPTNVVAPLETTYVERGPGDTMRTGTSRCGCSHEGIGCRDCGNSLGIRVRLCRRHTVAFDPDLDFTPDTVYVFNPYTTTHSSKRGIPFPYDLPYPQSPPDFDDTTFTAPPDTSLLTLLRARRSWRLPIQTTSSSRRSMSPPTPSAGLGSGWAPQCPSTPSDGSNQSTPTHRADAPLAPSPGQSRSASPTAPSPNPTPYDDFGLHITSLNSRLDSLEDRLRRLVEG